MGYLDYFIERISSPWWFIPALIPCLAAAPFLAKGFQALSDKAIKALCLVLVALFLYGAIFKYLQWIFDVANIEILSKSFEAVYRMIPPSLLVASPAYFEFFILGGICRRLLPQLTKKASALIITCGFACWTLDAIFVVLDIPRTDPSFFWLFVTLGIMSLFSRMKINSPAAKKIISWTAQRSYSIYILQFAVIGIVTGLFYEQSAFGDIAQMDVLIRIIVWVTATVGSYTITLIIASILDPFLLKPMQNLLRRAFTKNRILSKN